MSSRGNESRRAGRTTGLCLGESARKRAGERRACCNLGAARCNECCVCGLGASVAMKQGAG
eukprot:12310190-Alexandrium_andersonii.AAC.1